MAGKPGIYSNIIIYDERKRYYYLWPQKNKPLLDDEVRDMGIGLLDQVRRSVQANYGDVAAPLFQYSRTSADTTSAFKVIQHPTDTSSNFRVSGGNSLDHPGILYAKGYYVFIAENPIDYKTQYANVNLGTASDIDKDKTLKVVPSISTPSADRIDIVYIDLYFEEVTAATGTDTDIYYDSKLKNPVVGTETANRLRACIDVRVRENWTGVLDKGIFDNAEFLGGVSSSDTNPTNDHFKIPIAAIYRHAFSGSILTADIVDLLALFDKRIYSAEETTYRLKHGGYVLGDFTGPFTGITKPFPGAIVDEGAFATGLNKGLGPEALNSDAVTPRTVSSSGKFMMGGLMLGSDTGIITYETGPEMLQTGEAVMGNLSARHIYAGYGVTGITGARQYIDTVNAVIRGESGKSGLSVTNYDGETGSKTASIRAFHGGAKENSVTVDYRGRVGLDTDTPGWSGPSAEWNLNRYIDGLGGVTGVNVILDVNGSERVTKELFVDKDLYVQGDAFGRTWQIPQAISHKTPGLFGFSGIPYNLGAGELATFLGYTGSVANVIFKRGIAVSGETGVLAYGYTGAGIAGAYESYDSEGKRLFTIGDLGDGYDRNVKQPFGMSVREAFVSDWSFLAFPTGLSGQLLPGDEVDYTLDLDSGLTVNGSVTVGSTGMAGLAEVKSDILDNSQLPNPTHRYWMTYSYTFYEIDGTTETRTGMTEGVEIITDLVGFSLGFDYHGRLVFKSIPEDPVDVNLTAVTMTVKRGATTISVPFTRTHYFGSSEYGGDLASYKFAKFDLGDGADAWLFNGDVYFNGNGELGKVDFSPSVFFRDDVFVYGTMFADQIVFNLAKIISIIVENQLTVEKYGWIKKGLALGEPTTLQDLQALQATDTRALSLCQGKMITEDLEARSADSSTYTTGDVILSSSKNPGDVYVKLGGTLGDTSNPFGIKIVDGRTGITDDQAFKDLYLQAFDGAGNPRQVRLVISGDISTTRYFISKFMGVGTIDTINTDYALQVNGRALINDTLEVKALRFIGAESPEGITDIVDPANISVIGKASLQASGTGEDTQNNTVILREKKFTSNKRIYLDNSYDDINSGLTITPGDTGPQNYYLQSISYHYSNPDAKTYGRWALDNISYLEDQFNEIVTPQTNKNEIIVSEITSSYEKYKKYMCERVTLANLGNLHVEWSGYKYDPSGTTTTVINTYYFESPYFRNRQAGTIIDWFPESARSGDDNLTVKVEGSIIDTHPSFPQIYTISKSLAIYIPKSLWLTYMSDAGTGTNVGSGATDLGYRSFAIFYPYEDVINHFNEYEFDNQTNFTSQQNEYSDPGWRLALYPRLSKLVRVPVGTNLDKTYAGDWDLDLVIVPRSVGRIANTIGKLYISYMQS